MSLSASDDDGGVGVDRTYFTVDGSTPSTSSPVYAAPFALSGTATVKFFSTDVAGNAGAVVSQLVRVDVAAPVTTASCNASACAGWYRANVTIALSPTDADSGVSMTYYTTNGSTPTTSSRVYTAPFTLSIGATVKFFSTDVAGNAEAVVSQPVQIDKTRPGTPSITCNAATCSTGWYRTAPVTVGLSATDSGGSGVQIHFTVDGSTPTASSALYGGPFPLAETSTVKAIAVDGAGNVSGVLTRTIKIDAAGPTVVLTAPTDGLSIRRGATVMVSATATATDAGSGTGSPSGIASVRFYRDGILIPGTDKTAPYAITWTLSRLLALGMHTLTAVATDVAGNSTTSAAITVTVTS